MKRLVFSSLVVLLLNLPNYSLVRPTQGSEHQGAPVPVTQLGPKRSGPRWSYSDGSCLREPIRVVIRDGDAWNKMWREMFANPLCGSNEVPPPPPIDFTREMIIVAALGARPTSGYGIVIDQAYERGDRLEVVVRSILPGGGTFQVLTNPVDVVRLPKTQRPVIFREIQTERLK